MFRLNAKFLNTLAIKLIIKFLQIFCKPQFLLWHEVHQKLRVFKCYYDGVGGGKKYLGSKMEDCILQ